MMTVDGLFKEFGEAFGRLFDHRPVLQGEINFCQREFEEKRGNREETRLRKSLEYGREINGKFIPQIIESLQTDLPKFGLSVTEAVSLSQQIMDKENVSAKDEWLEQRRLQRSHNWSGFLDTMTSKVSDIDHEFANEVALVTAHYKELEEKLKITDRKERAEVAQHNKMEIEQERVSVSEKDMAEVVKDGVTTAPEAKVGDGQEGDRVEVTQKDKAEVDCSEEIAEETKQSVQENKEEVNNSIRIAEEAMVKVAQDDKTDTLSNSENCMNDKQEINLDKAEIDK